MRPFIDDLSQALAQAGIDRRRRSRILTEFEDHLASDPGADLGSPQLLARQFADELGTDLARQAAIRAFWALAVAGVLFAAAFLAGARAHSFVPIGGGARHLGLYGAVAATGAPVAVRVAMLVCAVAAQVALVAGTLGVLRAVHLRRQLVVSKAEARILTRRAGVALSAGAITMLALAVVALALPAHSLSSGWRILAYVAAGLALLSIAAATPAVAAAARLRPEREGAAGDLLADLDPIAPVPLPASPWQFAFLVSFGVAVVLAAAGVIQSDPYDGALRGLADGLACLAGFALLGGYLGLRASTE